MSTSNYGRRHEERHLDDEMEVLDSAEDGTLIYSNNNSQATPSRISLIHVSPQGLQGHQQSQQSQQSQQQHQQQHQQQQLRPFRDKDVANDGQRSRDDDGHSRDRMQRLTDLLAGPSILEPLQTSVEAASRQPSVKASQEDRDSSSLIEMANGSRGVEPANGMGTPLATASQDAVYCSRCRNYKKLSEFMDGDRRRKTCSSCRLYGKKYIKKKSLTNAAVSLMTKAGGTVEAGGGLLGGQAGPQGLQYLTGQQRLGHLAQLHHDGYSHQASSHQSQLLSHHQMEHLYLGGLGSPASGLHPQLGNVSNDTKNVLKCLMMSNFGSLDEHQATQVQAQAQSPSQSQPHSHPFPNPHPNRHPYDHHLHQQHQQLLLNHHHHPQQPLVASSSMANPMFLTRHHHLQPQQQQQHHVPTTSPGDSLLLLEDYEAENDKFMDNLRWMYEHVKENVDNAHHIQALHLAFGKAIEGAREIIETELAHHPTSITGSSKRNS